MPSSTTKYIVDNQTGLTAEQTIYSNLTIDGNVNITGTTNIRPYKVFTALLTQSGTSSSQPISEGDLTVGVTYFIDDSTQADFTNVGAPNNTAGTYFIASDITPNSWGDGILLYNIGAPVAKVLENTIGNIWFTYSTTGFYIVSSDGLFTTNKSSIIVGNVTWDGSDGTIRAGFDGINECVINTVGDNGTSGDNFALVNTLIEIRVYN
jgi:hypothetical protein